MGILFDRIVDLSIEINWLFNMSMDIDTFRLQHKMVGSIWWSFKSLNPLRYDKITVELERENEDNLKVDIHDTLFKSGRTLSYKDYDYANIMRNFGYEILPYVREDIQDRFRELVCLSKQLIPYKHHRVKRNTDFMLRELREGNNLYVQEEAKIHKMEILTNKSSAVFLYSKGDTYKKKIDNISTVVELEDHLETIKEMYKEAWNLVMPTREHNNNILNQISEVVKPIIISNELGKE